MTNEDNEVIISRSELQKVCNEFQDISLKENDYDLILSNFHKVNYEKSEFCTSLCQILKNLSNSEINLFSTWIRHCKKGGIYSEEELKSEWKNTKKCKNNDDFFNLLAYLKWQNRNDIFDHVIHHLHINEILRQNNDKFPKNDLIVNKVIDNDNFYHIMLNDPYCPLIDRNHEQQDTYMEICKHGQCLMMKCHYHSCRGKCYPTKPIPLTDNQAKCIFINQVNIQINNYNNDITESSLISSIPTFNVFEDQTLNKLVFSSLIKNDADFGFLAHYISKDTFYHVGDGIWYEFKDHKWNINGNIVTFVIDKISILYDRIISELKENNQISSKDNENLTKLLDNAKRYVRSHAGITKIIKQTEERFNVNKKRNYDFCDHLDSKPYLIGFENGVYDLKGKIFRGGNPDDMISMSVCYNFPTSYSNKKDGLLKFLDDILPVNEDRTYILTYISTCLARFNECEKFPVLTGGGRNGKSKFVDLIAKTLGNYFKKAKCKMLTGKRPDDNSPEPGLLSMAKKRIVICSEPEKGETLNTGFIKFITGGDSCDLRKCHQNEIYTFKANFITLLVCNDIPPCDDNNDQAFKKRLVCINFPTEFVENPIKENQKLLDTKLSLKLEDWKEDFMLLLLEYYELFQTKGLKVPTNINTCTSNYNIENDPYLSFKYECLEESKYHTSSVEMYACFTRWYDINFPTKQKQRPNSKKFIEIMSTYLEYSNVKIENGRSTTGYKNIIIKTEYKKKNIFENKNIHEAIFKSLNGKISSISKFIYLLICNKFYIKENNIYNFNDEFIENFNFFIIEIIENYFNKFIKYLQLSANNLNKLKNAECVYNKMMLDNNIKKINIYLYNIFNQSSLYDNGSLYLIQAADDKNTNIYKIGKSKNLKNRMSSYKLDRNEYVFSVIISKLSYYESELKILFNNIFTLYRGSEWFIGDIIKMKKIFINFCSNISNLDIIYFNNIPSIDDYTTKYNYKNNDLYINCNSI
jgi:P4 family phage/plasmid primase-like protien